MGTSLPYVGVAATRNVPGVNNLADGGTSFLRVLPLDEALLHPWKTDAHLVTYRVSKVDKWPRCNKPALPQVRQAGCEIYSTMLVFDYDNPGHRPWSEGEYEDFVGNLFDVAEDGFPLALSWSAFYTTQHGARFVYVLTDPVPVDESEPLARGVVRDFARRGIHLDDKCCDWTHLFRLPCVTRSGEATWEADYFELVSQWDVRLDPATIEPAEPRPGSDYGMVEPLDLPQPSPEEAYSLLFEQTETGERKTKWFKDAKRRLKNRSCYEVIFEHHPLGQPGNRDSTLQRLVGEALALLYHVEGTSPELIYALFLPAAEQLDPDDGTPDWTEALWASVLRYWAREKAKDLKRLEQQELAKESTKHLSLRVLEGMRQWCEHPGIWRTESDSIAWMAQHIIISTPAAFHVVNREGQIDSTPVRRDQLPARIRELGMDELIPLVRETENGFKEVPAQTLINQHATVVSHVEGAVDLPHTVVRDIGEATATLVVKLFDLRTDLEPRFDKEVDDWLRLFGGERYEQLVEWISHALAFRDGPICALSIAGPPGCGKKLLVQGLAECISTECVGDEKEFGQFQSMLMRTPFISVNEGLPKGVGQKDVADTFRHLVSGDPILVNQKFKDPVLVRNPARIIFAANNTDVVSMLTGHRDLSPDDRDALAVRLLHLDVPPETSEYLRMKGGLAYTGQFGRRWIRGDGGAASDYVLARHFLWLYHHRTPAPAGNRLLVEGDMDRDLLRLMSTRSGTAPDVIEALIKMIEQGVANAGVVVHEGRIYATTSAVVDWHRTNSTSRNDRVNHKSVSSVFRGLSKRGSSRTPRKLATAGGDRRARWYEIDGRTLLVEAIEHGYRCERLAKVVAKHEAEAVEEAT
ncbi:MAG: primase-helicase family protein [Planctomycetota bacterium JB042]